MDSAYADLSQQVLKHFRLIVDMKGFAGYVYEGAQSGFYTLSDPTTDSKGGKTILPIAGLFSRGVE